jgi:hypothetical protein
VCVTNQVYPRGWPRGEKWRAVKSLKITTADSRLSSEPVYFARRELFCFELSVAN